MLKEFKYIVIRYGIEANTISEGFVLCENENEAREAIKFANLDDDNNWSTLTYTHSFLPENTKKAFIKEGLYKGKHTELVLYEV